MGDSLIFTRQQERLSDFPMFVVLRNKLNVIMALGEL